VDLKNPADSVDPAEDHMLDAVMAGVLRRWAE